MRKGPDYTCDWCKAVLSDRGAGEPHLSLVLGPESGVAALDAGLWGWRLTKQLRARRYHFCGVACLARYLARVCALPLPAELGDEAETLLPPYAPPVLVN